MSTVRIIEKMKSGERETEKTFEVEGFDRGAIAALLTLIEGYNHPTEVDWKEMEDE